MTGPDTAGPLGHCKDFPLQVSKTFNRKSKLI